MYVRCLLAAGFSEVSTTNGGQTPEQWLRLVLEQINLINVASKRGRNCNKVERVTLSSAKRSGSGKSTNGRDDCGIATHPLSCFPSFQFSTAAHDDRSCKQDARSGERSSVNRRPNQPQRSNGQLLSIAKSRSTPFSPKRTRLRTKIGGGLLPFPCPFCAASYVSKELRWNHCLAKHRHEIFEDAGATAGIKRLRLTAQRRAAQSEGLSKVIAQTDGLPSTLPTSPSCSSTSNGASSSVSEQQTSCSSSSGSFKQARSYICPFCGTGFCSKEERWTHQSSLHASELFGAAGPILRRKDSSLTKPLTVLTNGVHPANSEVEESPELPFKGCFQSDRDSRSTKFTQNGGKEFSLLNSQRPTYLTCPVCSAAFKDSSRALDHVWFCHLSPVERRRTNCGICSHTYHRKNFSRGFCCPTDETPYLVMEQLKFQNGC